MNKKKKKNWDEKILQHDKFHFQRVFFFSFDIFISFFSWIRHPFALSVFCFSFLLFFLFNSLLFFFFLCFFFSHSIRIKFYTLGKHLSIFTLVYVIVHGKVAEGKKNPVIYLKNRVELIHILEIVSISLCWKINKSMNRFSVHTI